MSAEQDRLEALCRELGLAQHVRLVDRTSSTQDDALALARELGPCAVIASHQSAGRGRLGAPWLERPGLGLACTVALSAVGLALDELPARVGVASALAAEAAGLDRAGIKWPNDIVDARCRKLAGVLIEVRDGWALIGAGFNVGHGPEDLDEVIRERAVSLAMLGVRTSPLELAENFLRALAEALAAPVAKILDQWMSRDVLVGTTRSFRAGDRSITGRIESIDPTREIVVRTSSGPVALDPRSAKLIQS